MNQFSLVQAVDRFSQGVVIAVAPAADRRFDARFGQPFAVANADVLGPLCPNGVSRFRRCPAPRVKRLFKCIQNEVRVQRGADAPGLCRDNDCRVRKV